MILAPASLSLQQNSAACSLPLPLCASVFCGGLNCFLETRGFRLPHTHTHTHPHTHTHTHTLTLSWQVHSLGPGNNGKHNHLTCNSCICGWGPLSWSATPR